MNFLSRFLTSRSARILSVVLLLQALALYGLNRREVIPNSPPLSALPNQIESWRLLQEGVMDKETLEVLKADDTLTRTYGDGRRALNLFIAFFRSQRTGKAPHSPKNCLPGNGWVQDSSQIIHIDIPNRAEPIEANEYVVARGDYKSVVLYWYQSRDRSVASEYNAKLYVMADAIRYNRTDTALVRVVVPVTENRVDVARQTAIDFVRASFPEIRKVLPA